MSEQHTPWQIIGEDAFPHVHNSLGECVAADVPRAAAELIVRAVNGESELLAALVGLLPHVVSMDQYYGGTEAFEAVMAARAAIAKARS